MRLQLLLFTMASFVAVTEAATGTVDPSNCPVGAKCVIKNGVGEITFSRRYEFDSIKMGGGDAGIILLNVTTSYTTFPGEEFVYKATPYNNGTLDVRLLGPEPFYITRNGAIFTKGNTWDFFAANRTTTITGGSTILVSYHNLPFTPGGAGGGVVPPSLTGPLGEVLLRATNLVLVAPVSFGLGGLFLIIAVFSHITDRARARLLALGGLFIISVNWLLANQSQTISSLLGFQVTGYKESPLVFQIFGLSATTLGFFGLLIFITALGVAGALALALRE